VRADDGVRSRDPQLGKCAGIIQIVPNRGRSCVDLQKCFVDTAPDGLAVVDEINRLAAACRETGIVVIHTRHRELIWS
jgi:hypothetical protein